jgi:hypothetical protein
MSNTTETPVITADTEEIAETTLPGGRFAKLKTIATNPMILVAASTVALAAVTLIATSKKAKQEMSDESQSNEDV